MAITAQESPPGVVLKQWHSADKGIAHIPCQMQQFHVIAGHVDTT